MVGTKDSVENQRVEHWTTERVEQLFQMFVKSGPKNLRGSVVSEFRNRIKSDSRLGDDGRAAVDRWYQSKITT